MKRSIILIMAAVLTAGGCKPGPTAPSGDRASAIVGEMLDGGSRRVLVASHRGDWRNYPENSLAAIESAIAMGVDIIELDLKLTLDSVLVLMHDRSIDRTTTGRGRVSDIAYDSIRRVKLRAGQGVATHWDVPTLEEALAVCKGRAVVNIDQGFQYYDLIHPVLERSGMLDQTLIKGRVTRDEAERTFSRYEHNCLFMPIVNYGKKECREVLASYSAAAPLAYEVCWTEYTSEVATCMAGVLAQGSKLWVNSLWPSLNGGLCDDAAVEGDAAAVYGRLVDMGATLIQTDRPELLLNYLRSEGLHD